MAGWWRRNGWALPVCVLALAVAGVPDAKDAYDAYRQRRPVEAVRPGGDGWVHYGKGAVRAVRLAPTPAVDRDGAPVRLPPGTATWRATLEFDVPDPEALSGCTVRGRSDKGNLYSADPGADLGAAALTGIIGCTPSGLDAKGPQKFTTTPTFLLPAGERLVAVQVSQPTQLPRYAELTAG